MSRQLLYCIPPEKHDEESLKAILGEHPEVAFVSLVGVDINGNDTDEKIPVRLFLHDIKSFLAGGVQTDGSSVQLPLIADIANAKVTFVPDTTVNWYVDHNLDAYADDMGGSMPLGTLRIPATLMHNETLEVGSRAILKNASECFKRELKRLLEQYPYVMEYLPIDSA
ncbi:MAG: glutamine synthetase, partial [Firmicutes bacterium]|nr:glutamine synthetase [Bacillota bacterium]